jgi:hypothetical protein
MPGPFRYLFCVSPVSLPWLVRRRFVPTLKLCSPVMYEKANRS